MTDETKILYHYTDATGLLGILGGKIWATSILHLNDSQEFLFLQTAASVFVGDRLAQWAESKGGTDSIKMGKEMKSAISKLLGRFKPDQYVFCLSEKDNALSQWRGYSPQDGGFALGFNPGLLPDALGLIDDSLLKCEYGLETDEAKQTLDSISTDFINGLNSFLGPTKTFSEANVVEAILRLGRELEIYSPKYKHPSFKEEMEWRVVVNLKTSPTLETQYRVSRFGITPYVEIPSNKDKSHALERIVIGPTRHPELVQQTITGLLSHNGWKDVEVSISETPYRT